MGGVKKKLPRYSCKRKNCAIIFELLLWRIFRILERNTKPTSMFQCLPLSVEQLCFCHQWWESTCGWSRTGKKRFRRPHNFPWSPWNGTILAFGSRRWCPACQFRPTSNNLRSSQIRTSHPGLLKLCFIRFLF